jgi:hypothetical protein
MDQVTIASAVGRAFLDLLDREAPAAEFEVPLQRAHAAAAPAELLAELEAAKLVALRVRGELEQHRRRETELAALFETAGDLAAPHDLDSVLRAIVRRARLLLGTDVSYLTLNDPAGDDTFMRVTSGSVSAFFQQLRLGVGEGLGGLVAQRAAPYSSSDYLSDPRFLHTASIDRGVREEGLVAILGVPLMLRGRVIGVLFAADRRSRAFGPSEVSLLGSMAAHAAIAIDAANALEDTRKALAELDAASTLIERHSIEVERTSQAHRRFTELVLAGGTAEDIARAVAAVLGHDVAILGEQGSVLAASGPPPPAADPALLRAVSQARPDSPAVYAGNYWTVPASAGAEHLGTLVLRAEADLPEADRLILERGAMVTALLLLLRRSVTEAEHRVRGELLGDLLRSPDRDAGSLRARALRLGADLDRPHVLVAAQAGRAPNSRLRAAASHLAATRHGLAAEHHDTIVLLIPADDAAWTRCSPWAGPGRRPRRLTLASCRCCWPTARTSPGLSGRSSACCSTTTLATARTWCARSRRT